MNVKLWARTLFIHFSGIFPDIKLIGLEISIAAVAIFVIKDKFLY